MITSVYQTQPQFRAKMYSCDISVLFNETKRSKAPQKAANELVALLKGLEKVPAKEATLVLNSGKNQEEKFNILLDGKKGYSGNINFTEALRNGLKIDFAIDNEAGKKISNKKITGKSVQKFALDA